MIGKATLTTKIEYILYYQHPGEDEEFGTFNSLHHAKVARKVLLDSGLVIRILEKHTTTTAIEVLEE